MFTRVSYFLYGVFCYVVFLASFVYAIGFIGDFLTPTRLDAQAEGPLGRALAVDLALLAAFAIQHSVMARPWFKRAWTKIVPVAAERSTYVLFSSLALFALYAWWQPIGGEVWTITQPVARAVIHGVYALGWIVLLLSTFMLNHFDLFGLRQAWLALLGRPYTRLKFEEPALYRIVRHPIYVGWFLIFWATPDMTAAHLLFAIMTTAYIVIAVQLEERDLIREHGDSYREYRDRVPAFFPALRRWGAIGFTFFLVKGLLWVVVPSILWTTRG